MPKARTTNSPPPDLASPEEEHVDPALGFLEVNEEQEDAVAQAIEASAAGVFEFIRGNQLEDIIHDHTAAIVTDDIARIYATVDIRYDPGHDQSLPTPTDEDPLLQYEDTTASTTSASQQNLVVERNGSKIKQYEHPIAGTLWPSPEPQPAPIDRWARGWVAAKSGNARRWNQSRNGGISEDGSDGGRSIRSARSMGTSLSSAHRHGGHARHRQHNSSNKEDRLGVPFPIAPEPREDQSLPPPVPRKDRGGGVGKRKGVGGGRRGRSAGKGGGGGGGGGSIGSGDGLENDQSLEGSAIDGEEEDDDIGSRVKDLGGREWTLDASGELLVVDRPQGDAMPKTIVSTLYNFRDVQQRGGGGGEGIPEHMGGGAGGDGRDKRRGGGGGKRKSISSSASAFGKGRKQSSSALRRASRRRSSRRLSGRRRRTGVFFELEPTLQPNLTNSLDRPGPGVTVSDGSSLKEGPTWPQDPNHMSRSEYQQRQRQQDLCDANTLDGGGDASTIGFSLGSVQSAPALGGLGLGLDGSGDGGGGGGGDDGGRQSLSGSGGGGGRGTSITAFEDVNPFAGGVRATTSAPTCRGGAERLAAGSPAGGDLSPLSASIGGQSGAFFSVGGPESSSLGDDSDDPHLALVNDPEWGRNVRGSPKESGFLPKVRKLGKLHQIPALVYSNFTRGDAERVKQVSRERPLTHERPHTRNPRDPRYVPARQHAHVSPKTKHDGHHQRGDDRSKGGVDDGRSQKMGVTGASVGSSSFPSLSMPLAGWGAEGGGAPYFGVGGASWGAARSRGGEGTISMTKPKDILVQGLLR